MNPQLLILIPVSLALNVFWLWWGLPNGINIWAVDGIAPLEPLVAAKRMFFDDWWNSKYINKYPMGYFFVLLAVYAPYVLYLFATGGLRRPTDIYPFGLSDPEMALTVFTLLANGVSAIMGTAIVVLIYLTARELFDQRAALFSALIICFSPTFIYYSHTSNVDIPSLFWCALGLFAFARLVQGKVKRVNYVLLGLAAGMAMATKEQVFGLFVLVPFSVLVLHIKHHRDTHDQVSWLSIGEVTRALLSSKILYGVGICILTFALATHLIFNWDANISRLVWRVYKTQPEFAQTYAAPPLEVSGLFDAWHQTFWLLWDSMNPFLFLASIAGVVWFSFKERWAGFFLVPLFSYLCFTIPMLTFLRVRFVMETVLVLALFGGRILSGVWAWTSKRYPAFVIALCMLWAYSFFYGFSVNYLMMYDARYKAEEWIQTNIPVGASIETYSEPTYLPRLPKNLNVTRSSFSEDALIGLRERSPDYLVLTGAQHNRFKEVSPQKKLLARLLHGDFGYQPIRVFQTEPLLGPNPIPGLSPTITILKKP